MARGSGSGAEKTICSMVGITKRYEKKVVIKDISLSYFYGAKIGVLGMNGSGKSSLLRIMAGVDKDFEGEFSISPDVTVGYLEQEPLLGETRTVREVVEEGAAEKIALLKEYEAIGEQFAQDMSPEAMEKLIARQGDVQDRIDAADAWEVEHQLEMAMDALRCPPGDAKVNLLSGGERRRVALCRLLLRVPDVLLLDEPTNHLDAESVGWLEQHLQRYAGTVIAVTHDRYFLDNVAGWILELDRGEGIPWKGNYSSWLDQKEKRLRIEERQESHRQKALKREMEWLGRSPQARQAKNKARVSAYESLLSQDMKERAASIEIFVPPGKRLGNLVIEMKNVSKTYGETLLFENLSFSLAPGAILGIIGANGAGKTTLFRMITGSEEPDSGEVRIGPTVEMAYAEQGREGLDAGKSVWEVISNGDDELKLGSVTVNSRAYVARFGFAGADQQKRVETLSGGERNRVQLAKVLKSGANVLLLDEPTNDLDVRTLRALEEALEGFAGSAIVITHDRYFLDRVATHILAFEGESRAVLFEGTYWAYEEDRRARLGEDALSPKRIKYRKLTRS